MMEKSPNATNKEINRFRELAAKRATLLDVADELGWSVTRVQYWERRLDILLRRGGRRDIGVLPAQEAKLRKCAAEGLSIEVTAKRMGWHRDKVRYWENQLDLHFPRLKAPRHA